MRHLETPVIRSRRCRSTCSRSSTREQGITVVATGEGADELYWGYDLFKEAKVRAFCARDPDAAWRASLFDRCTRTSRPPAAAAGESWRRFFLDAGPAERSAVLAPDAHRRDLRRQGVLLGRHARSSRPASIRSSACATTCPRSSAAWSALERAAYLELTTLLGNHLLAAQADRVGMAHGVEGRFPFLDHRVFEHSVASPPAGTSWPGLHEKIARAPRRAPRSCRRSSPQRPKQPYRAPEAAAFFAERARVGRPSASRPRRVRDVGIYDERAVAGLVRRCRAGRATGFRENMALIGVLSTQVWHETFCTAAR